MLVSLLEKPYECRVLVISEDWCGTCLAHVPFVAKLVEGHANIEMRLFPRDANLDLMDQYLKKGRYRSIPVFAFFDVQTKSRLPLCVESHCVARVAPAGCTATLTASGGSVGFA